MMLNKKLLSVRDICTKYRTPALESAGWYEPSQAIPVDTMQVVEGATLLFPKRICQVVIDQPSLIRRERAMNVKKRDYFTKYGEQARWVLEALLDKYANEDIENLDPPDVLKVLHLTQFNSPIEVLRKLGGKERFLSVNEYQSKFISKNSK